AGKRASGQAGLPEKAQSRWPGAFSRLFFNDSSSSMAPSGGSGSSSRSAVAPAGACADGAGVEDVAVVALLLFTSLLVSPLPFSIAGLTSSTTLARDIRPTNSSLSPVTTTGAVD